MSTSTTTLRLSTELRDEIAQLARASGVSMSQLVSEAIEQLKRQRWWDAVHHSLDDLAPDYRKDNAVFDGASGDGVGA